MSNVCFGMEYELEDVYNSHDHQGWSKVRDGTLRDGGIEFVLKGKQSKDNLIDLAKNLIYYLDEEYVVSHRCSSHIHVDCTNLDRFQSFGLAVGLVAHDDWFFQFNRDRKKNNFCVPVLWSPAIFRIFDWMVSSNGHDTFNKYLSINPTTYSTLGTLELRHFPPLVDISNLEAVLSRVERIYDIVSSEEKGEDSVIMNNLIEAFPDVEKQLHWAFNMLDCYASSMETEDIERKNPSDILLSSISNVVDNLDTTTLSEPWTAPNSPVYGSTSSTPWAPDPPTLQPPSIAIDDRPSRIIRPYVGDPSP